MKTTGNFIGLQNLLITFNLVLCPRCKWLACTQTWGKTDFSIWRHIVEQVYLGYNHNKSQQVVRHTCLCSREGNGVKDNFFVYILAQRLYTICVILWEIYPIFTILDPVDIVFIKTITGNCVLDNYLWYYVLDIYL